MLDQAGDETRPIDKSQETFFLGKNFRPKLPPEFGADVFRWNPTLRVQGDLAVLPREDIEKTTVMPKRRTQFFLYFASEVSNRRTYVSSFPKSEPSTTKQNRTFVFKFQTDKG